MDSRYLIMIMKARKNQEKVEAQKIVNKIKGMDKLVFLIYWEINFNLSVK